MPDPIANQTNQNNLRLYRSAWEQGILKGIQVEPCKDACEPMKNARDTVYSLWDVPTFPVPGCDIPDACACTYRAVFEEDIQIRKR